jgi:protein CpxP
MSNSKVYKIGFSVMLVINITVIAFLLIGPPAHPQRGPSGAHQRDLKDEISNGLQLNEEQRHQYLEMAVEHREELRIIERSQKELASQYLGFLKLTEVSDNEMAEVLSRLSQLESAKIDATYEHFEELKKLCTASQLADFDKIMDQVISVLLDRGNKNSPPPRGR